MASTASAPRLFDHTGTEIPLPGPPTPPVGIVLDGVESDFRDRYRNYPSRQLTPNRIVQILEQADAGNPFELVELLEEMLEKDPKLASVFQTRTSSILGLAYEVAPPKLDGDISNDKAMADEIAQFCYRMLDSCNFPELIADMTDAICKPYAVDWIDWGEDRNGKIVPIQFLRIPPTHIRWAFYEQAIYVYDPYTPDINLDAAHAGEFGAPLPPYQTVRALYQQKRDNPTRAGIGRTLIWPYLFKVTVLKDMVTYADRFGLPPRILRIDQSDFDNAERYQKFRQAMRDFGSDLSGVISKNAELDVKVVATHDGISVFINQIDYFDKLMAWAVLGHELSSQSSPRGGGQLGITAALQVRQDILEGDCEWIAETVKRDIFTPIVGWNYGWDKTYLTPNLQFKYEPPRDLRADADILASIFTTFPDLTVSEQAVRDQFGIPEPIVEADNEDELKPRQGGTGGGGPAPTSPSIKPDGNEGNQPLGVNSTRRGGGVLAASKKAILREQAPVDVLTERSVAAAVGTTKAWAEKIAGVLRKAMDDGETAHQARLRVIAAFPDLPTEGMRETLRQGFVLARLHGRVG